MPPAEEPRRPIVTITLGYDGMEMVEELAKRLPKRFGRKRWNRSEIIRRALAVYYQWVLNGSMPNGY